MTEYKKLDKDNLIRCHATSEIATLEVLVSIQNLLVDMNKTLQKIEGHLEFVEENMILKKDIEDLRKMG